METELTYGEGKLQRVRTLLLLFLHPRLHPQKQEPDRDPDQHQPVHDRRDLENLPRGVAGRRQRSTAAPPALRRRPQSGRELREAPGGARRPAERRHLVVGLEPRERVQAFQEPHSGLPPRTGARDRGAGGERCCGARDGGHRWDVDLGIRNLQNKTMRSMVCCG